MTRRYKPPSKKKKGGVLIGMRHGVQKVAGKVVGTGDDDPTVAAPKTGWSKVWSVAGNVLSVALLVVAAAVFLRRCGVLKF